MQNKKPVVYPYIPNSVPATKQQMLEVVGAKSVEEFFEEIPEKLRLEGNMKLPPPFLSEYSLKKHVLELLNQNKTAEEMVSFLGAGCYQHHVPAICDEINSRGEFLTAYAGEPYDDHGRFQALFEYTSMMGELLNMDVVNVPTYDGFQAAATSLRMASRLTGRREFLIAKSINPRKLSKILDYCQPDFTVRLIDFDTQTGLFELNELQELISTETAAVYFDNPAYFGFIETHGEKGPFPAARLLGYTDYRYKTGRVKHDKGQGRKSDDRIPVPVFSQTVFQRGRFIGINRTQGVGGSEG